MKKLLSLFMICTAAIFVMAACDLTQNSSKPEAQPQQSATSAPQEQNHMTPTAQATPAAQAQAHTDEQKFIGEEQAERIALERAGFSADEVTFINIDLDYDDGIWKYEVSFRNGKLEYETDINAVDGAILSWEVDN